MESSEMETVILDV